VSTSLLDLDEKLGASHWGDANTGAVLPQTSAQCQAQGWAAATGLFLCDGATDQIDIIGAVNCAQTNAPLTQRIFTGIKYGGSLAGKLCVETQNGTTKKFLCADTTKLDLTTSNISISVLYRTAARSSGTVAQVLCGKQATGIYPGYVMYLYGDSLYFYLGQPSSFEQYNKAYTSLHDGCGHVSTYSVTRGGKVYLWHDFDAVTDLGTCTKTNSATNNLGFFISGSTNGASLDGQIAWVYVSFNAVDGTGHNNLVNALWPWRSEYATHTRNGRIVVQVGVAAAATFAAGQPAHGYDAATADVGLVASQPVSFLGIGSRYLPGFSAFGNSLAAVEGPDRMLTAARVTQGGGNWNPSAGNYYAYTPLPYSTIAAPSNDTYLFGGWVKRGTVNATGRVGFDCFTGGTTEFTTIWSSDETPTAWTFVFGTFTMANASNTKGCLLLGAKTIADNCDFWGWFVVKAGVAVPAAWLLTSAGAVEALAAQATTVTNDGTKLLASRGRVTATLQNLNTVAGKHVALWAESTNASPYLEMGATGADLYITIRDSSRTLVATVTATSAITLSAHTVQWEWNATQAVSGANFIRILVDGVELAAGQTSAWTPPADNALTPIGVGGGNGANELHGAFSEIVVYDTLIPSGTLTAAEVSDAKIYNFFFRCTPRTKVTLRIRRT
jgi:hypothetical protein